jgi:hypothetical protein
MFDHLARRNLENKRATGNCVKDSFQTDFAACRSDPAFSALISQLDLTGSIFFADMV